MIYEGEQMKKEEEIQIGDLEQAPPKMEDNNYQVHDPMEEVNLGTMEEPKITYINSLLPIDLKEQIVSQLQNSRIASLRIMMKCQDWIGALWNIALSSGSSSILSSNHLEGCLRK